MATCIPTATSPRATSLLGQTYPGQPIRLALQLWKLEQAGKSDKARALLDAQNRVRVAFGGLPYDLASDFTDLPMEGGFLIRSVPMITETPRPLNARLWELTAKQTSCTIVPAELVELNALCARLEGAAA